jgi:hypothetical protein
MVSRFTITLDESSHSTTSATMADGWWRFLFRSVLAARPIANPARVTSTKGISLSAPEGLELIFANGPGRGISLDRRYNSIAGGRGKRL